MSTDPNTCRGPRAFRDCNNQLDVPSYVGTLIDDKEFPFPIYDRKTLFMPEGNTVWTPTCEEIVAVQKKRA